MRFWTTVAALTLSASAPLPALAQEPPAQASVDTDRAEVLVLGTYHMANPGRDVVNMEADDVLAPKRQAEIAEVVSVLERFRPTKIAVEADHDDDAVIERYERYLAGEHELSRNETEQIGFRLAETLGHATVHPVDADGEFPMPRVVDFAETHGRKAELDALMAEIREHVQGTEEKLASHTVLETLLSLNADDKVARDVGFYHRLAHFGEPGDWAGADLLTAWYRRNIRIYSNVVDLVESADAPADERVLVVFGAGHLGWLRHSVAADPTIRLRKLVEWVDRKSEQE